MQRTNIYLSDEQQRILRARAEEEGVSKAEIIRRLLDDALGLSAERPDRVAAAKATAGIWSDRADDDVDTLRRWRSIDRLERLGL